MFKVSLLFREEEEESLSAALIASAGSAHSVDVLLDIKRRVELDNPINFRDIQSTSCNISAKKDSFFELSELVEGG